MKIETIAVHGGYTPDPTTKAVAVPIYPRPENSVFPTLAQRMFPTIQRPRSRRLG